MKKRGRGRPFEEEEGKANCGGRRKKGEEEGRGWLVGALQHSCGKMFFSFLPSFLPGREEPPAAISGDIRSLPSSSSLVATDL